MKRKLDIKRTENRRNARYLIGRILLSFGSLISGSFFTYAITMTQEEDHLLNMALFYFGVGVVSAFLGGMMTLMFSPDYGIRFAYKKHSDIDEILFQRASSVMGVLSIAALIFAALVFIFRHKSVTAIFLLGYGLYMGLVSLNFSKGRRRTWKKNYSH